MCLSDGEMQGVLKNSQWSLKVEERRFSPESRQKKMKGMTREMMGIRVLNCKKHDQTVHCWESTVQRESVKIVQFAVIDRTVR